MRALRGAIYGLLAFMGLGLFVAAVYAAGAYFGSDALWVLAIVTGVAFICFGVLVELEERLA